jgi:putative FmdB family regulatory protein
MPTYEYLCKSCGHEFEREQRMSDAPIKTCPSCKARQVKRLISRTSFHLKGGGWYSDLYSSSKKGSKKDADSTSGSSGAPKGDGGSGASSKGDSGAASKGDSGSASKGDSGSGGSGSGAKAAA